MGECDWHDAQHEVDRLKEELEEQKKEIRKLRTMVRGAAKLITPGVRGAHGWLTGYRNYFAPTEPWKVKGFRTRKEEFYQLIILHPDSSMQDIADLAEATLSYVQKEVGQLYDEGYVKRVRYRGERFFRYSAIDPKWDYPKGRKQ